ncbi:MAG TPA: ABC transporter substrate-binding protein, partial [Gaiellaceae bacterium]|nr:ABC transporter substrate-binding protein [Gaiellaceae bacterium]
MRWWASLRTRLEVSEVSRTPQWLFTTVLIGIAIALLVGACGGSRKKAGSVAPVPDGSAPTVAAADTRTFPIFRIATDPSIDYLDPGLTYTIAGSAVLWNAYLPLVGYKHVNGPDGATIVPYLARALPKVSSDGKTYTLALRTGLEYSNGQAVKASDFAYAIERVFQLDSPGAAFFRGIVGADSYAKTKRGHIAGIVTNDSTGQITIHLIAPQGDFDNILATEFAAPVPAGTPAKDQSTAPIPSTGPYMIKKYAPDNEIVEVRNPHFDAAVFDGQV